MEDIDLADVDEFYGEELGAVTARAAFPSLTQEIRERVDILSKNKKRELNVRIPENRPGISNMPYSSLQRTKFIVFNGYSLSAIFAFKFFKLVC